MLAKKDVFDLTPIESARTYGQWLQADRKDWKDAIRLLFDGYKETKRVLRLERKLLSRIEWIVKDDTIGWKARGYLVTMC